MKKLILFCLFIIVAGCESNKGVYWCGDHPCINKKEKEAYFKKTMTVEIRNDENINMNNKSEFEKISKQAMINEKKRILKERELKKLAKKQLKMKIKEEKKLKKHAKLEEKLRIKNEKELEKKIKLEDKKMKKKSVKKLTKEKSLDSAKKSIDVNIGVVKNEFNIDNFDNIVKDITKRNSSRPFPDINNVPNQL